MFGCSGRGLSVHPMGREESRQARQECNGVPC
jgi:hypothetical protein